MSDKNEALEIMKLLAGAAQAGAKGKVALAALDVMQASGRVQAAKMLGEGQNAEEAAMAKLLSAQAMLEEVTAQPQLMEEAKKDIAMANGRSYEY